MGNESSRPERPDGRSRSLSPLPRDDQFPEDGAGHGRRFPSTMPASYTKRYHGSAPPGSRGSLAWHRRRRRDTRGLSPESDRFSSRSPSPEPPPLNASQPAQSAARGSSPEQRPRPSTQPARSKPKKSRRRKDSEDGIKEAVEAARIEAEAYYASLKDRKKRRRRSPAPSPSPRKSRRSTKEADPPDVLDDAASLQRESQSPSPPRMSKRDKGKGKEVIWDVMPEEATTADDRSILDFGDELPPSAQQLGKRGRRGSDSKARKKRKSKQESDGEDHDDAEREGRFGLAKFAQSQPTVFEQQQSEDPASLKARRPSTADSRRSQSDSGYAEPDGQPPSASDSGRDLDIPDGLPRYEEHYDVTAGNGAEHHDNDSMSVASEHHDAASANGVEHDDNESMSAASGDHEAESDSDAGNDDDDRMSAASGDHEAASDSDAGHDVNDSRSAASEHADPSVVSRTPSPPPDRTVEDEEEVEQTEEEVEQTEEDVEQAEEEAEATEEEPASAPQDHEPTLTPRESPNNDPSPRQSAKRKAKEAFFAREEEENVNAFAELPADDAVSPPKRRSSRRVQPRAQGEAGPDTPATVRKTKQKKGKQQPDSEESEEQEVTEKSQYRSGALSRTEQNQIIRAVERFREDEGLTQEEINEVIHQNPQTSNSAIHRQLWASIQDACPSRPRKKLIGWCRQRFHNFAARGKWTREQDDELAELVEKHGPKWRYIGGLINRYQKDVRDRWRNYLVCRDNVKTDYWSEGEEERFRDLVENAIEKIQAGMKGNSKKSPEELINWMHMSEAMGRTRSRLQCMEKWKRMRAAEPLADQVPTVLPSGSSWRLEKARHDLQKISTADKYTLMVAVRDSGVGTEAKIPWKKIVNDTFGGKYERQALVVTWGRLRKAVPDWEWKTTRDCARYLCEMYEKEGNFGAAEQSEAEEVEEGVPSNSATSAKKSRKRKGKQVVQPDPADIPAPKSHSQATDDEELANDAAQPAEAAIDETPASSAPRQKRRKSRSKTSRSAAETVEPENVDVEMEDQAATQPEASPVEASPQPAPQPSPELGGGTPEPSPSVEAEASRTKRRERRDSASSKKSAKGKEREHSPPATAPVAASAKPSKRPRRASLPNGGTVDTPRKSKKQKTSESLSASKAKVHRTKAGKADKSKESKAARRSLSVISSDMDDMEDIPARLP